MYCNLYLNSDCVHLNICLLSKENVDSYENICMF